MKTSEKVYTALVFVMCGFLIIGAANLIFYIIPRMEENAANMFRLVSFVLGLYAATLAVTATINLKAKELKTISTIIQIVVLFLTGYGLPFAVWGIVLLVKANQGMEPTSANAQSIVPEG